MIYRAYQLTAFYVIEIVVEGLWPLKINEHFIDKVLVKGRTEYISLIFYSIIFIFEDSQVLCVSIVIVLHAIIFFVYFDMGYLTYYQEQKYMQFTHVIYVEALILTNSVPTVFKETYHLSRKYPEIIFSLENRKRCVKHGTKVISFQINSMSFIWNLVDN